MSSDSQLSRAVKNFLVQFEQEVLPHINLGRSENLVQMGYQPVSCAVSTETLADPQLKEMLNVGADGSGGKFMGITVRVKPDLEVIFNTVEE